LSRSSVPPADAGRIASIFGAEIVPVGQVEAKLALAPAASVAVAHSERLDPLLGLVAAILPRIDELDDGAAAHTLLLAEADYFPVSAVTIPDAE